MISFDFPPLRATGEGEIVYPPGTTRDDWQFASAHPVYWKGEDSSYGVTYQLDRPACAFRCHYPGGSAPCDEETARAFIRWVEEAKS